MREKLVSEIKEKGIVKIENFLNPNELNKLIKIVSFYSVSKNSPKSYFPVNIKTLILKILKLDFIKFSHSLILWKLKDEKKLDNLAKLFFNKQIKLNFIDAYYSKKSDKTILPWHTDQAYHGQTNVINLNHPERFFLKIFIYLTDVSANNGCMSYVPGSHKLGFAIRKAIYEKKIPYQPYWSLKEFKKIINDNLNFFQNYLNDPEIIKIFLDSTNNLENDECNLNNNKFCYSAKAGSAIIFDEGGVHQGSKPQYNDRMVLRYLYGPKEIN
jgi:hypothetical protein